MANLFDLLDLADGESGAAAVSVLVTKKKAEAAAAEAAARAEAEAARLAAKEAKRAAAISDAKTRAIDEIRRRRAARKRMDQLPADEEIKYTEDEYLEIAAAIAAAEQAADEEKEPRPKISFYHITQKQNNVRQLVDEQIQLAKEQSKLLEEQISLLDKQRKMVEENTEDVYSKAQIKLEEAQRKLAEDQNKLDNEQQQRFEKICNFREELGGQFDVKYRDKELSEAQTKFWQDNAKFWAVERRFWNEQRSQGRQGGYLEEERNQVYHGGNGNGRYQNGGNNAYYNGGYNGNAGYWTVNGSGHYYNGNAGYGTGNGRGHYYNGNGNHRNYENSYQFSGYSRGNDERQTEGGEHYGQGQTYRGAGKARRQNSEVKESDAGTDGVHKPEVKVSASSETEHIAVAVNGDAVPASVSETSTGDAVNGEGGTVNKKDNRNKKNLSGSQKRKKKREAGSKKDAGNEMEKAQQDSGKIVTEPKTEERKVVTLDEYEKVRGLKKSLEATTTTAAVAREITAEEFKGLQLLEKKKADEEEAIKKVEKTKHKEKAEKVQQGAKETKPDPKKVVNDLFKHAPRPRYQDDRYDRVYNNAGFHGPRGNGNDSRGSGRGVNVAGNNGNGASRGGGYSGRGGAQRGVYSAGPFSGRGNGGYQGGRGNGYQAYNGNGQYQQRAAGGYRGRGIGRPQQVRSPEEEFDINFPELK